MRLCIRPGALAGLCAMGIKFLVGVATVVWLLVIALGYSALLDYGFKPGVAGHPPAEWPSISKLLRNRDGPTLVITIHPHCPCSRASLAELSSILSEHAGRAKAYVLFVRPAGVAKGWEQTDLWRTAAAMPGVIPVPDESGREASRFGAATSGQTMLYDRNGMLRFSGGITAARGLYGDSAGGEMIAALLNDRPHSGHAPVYGCPLLNRRDAPMLSACVK